MTAYHVDRDQLVATHYCPQGNQPRLNWVISDQDDTFAFEFRDATDLDTQDEAHQHSLTLEFQEDGSVQRTEVYVSGDEESLTEVRFIRSVTQDLPAA